MSDTNADLKDVLVQFLGQTYNEIRKIDNNIIGSTRHLTQKGNEFEQVATQVLHSVGKVVNDTGPIVNQKIVGPVIAPHVQAAQQADLNQLEFEFDNSPTAKNIFASLARLEDKLDRLSSALSKMLETTKKINK